MTILYWVLKIFQIQLSDLEAQKMHIQNRLTAKNTTLVCLCYGLSNSLEVQKTMKDCNQAVLK